MKGTQFDLSLFQQNPDGSFSKKTTTPQPRDVAKRQVEYMDAKGVVLKATEYLPYSVRSKSIITIPGIVDGLNGDKGLMRGHWTKINKVKELFITIINDHLVAGKAFKHSGKVKIRYIGYKSVLMDWDNFCASFKHIGDSLVKVGVITEDKPAVVTEFVPDQVKCKRVEQCVVIIIEDVL